MEGNLIKSLLKEMLRRRGYIVKKVPPNYSEEKRYVLHSVMSADGQHDYNRYKRVQTTANKKKINRSFAQEEVICFAANYIKKRLPSVRTGICHGTRQGLEQKWFRRELKADVLGTEISDTASQFPHTIEWDFHETKPDWIDKFDFVYSNSFDHSYDPEKCLNAWLSCVRAGGICILEFSAHSGIWSADERDPFGAEIYDMPYIVNRWGCGRYAVREIVDVPQELSGVERRVLIVVYRFEDDWN